MKKDQHMVLVDSDSISGPFIARARKSDFIVRFPAQTRHGEWCPGFWYCKPALGCGYNCVGCFMHRVRRGFGHPNTIYTNWEDLYAELEIWIKNQPPRQVMGFGIETAEVLGDRELYKKVWGQYPEDIFVPLFEKYQKHDILFLTKSVNVQWFLDRKPSPWVILSFSTNGVRAAARWEVGTPPMHLRQEVIEKLVEQGWRVRLRVDPLQVDMEGWEEDIREHTSWINDVGRFETITSGVMRLHKVPICDLHTEISAISTFRAMLSPDLQRRFMTCKTHLELNRTLGLLGPRCNCLQQKKELIQIQV